MGGVRCPVARGDNGCAAGPPVGRVLMATRAPSRIYCPGMPSTELARGSIVRRSLRRTIDVAPGRPTQRATVRVALDRRGPGAVSPRRRTVVAAQRPARPGLSSAALGAILFNVADFATRGVIVS